MRRYVRFRARVVAIGVAALAIVVVVGTASAGPAGAVKTFTGCLVVGDGVIVKVKEGDQPKSSCTSGQTLARLSGGDITKVAVTGGLTLTNGGESGDVEINLDSKYSLPQNCSAPNVVAKWNGTSWVCAADNNTTYAADGTTLSLSSSNVFSVDPDYRVDNTSDCPNGQFANGFKSDYTIQCATPSVGTVQAFSGSSGYVQLAGTMAIVSLDLPAGKYVLNGSANLVNAADDERSIGQCFMPGFSTSVMRLESVGTDSTHNLSLSLSSAISHPGGAVELKCHENAGNVDVDGAALTAIKVDSIN